MGYPRQYPYKINKDYGTFDSMRLYRQYLQDPNKNTAVADQAAPCSQFDRKGNDGVTRKWRYMYINIYLFIYIYINRYIERLIDLLTYLLHIYENSCW